jgi:hypothetical protein
MCAVDIGGAVGVTPEELSVPPYVRTRRRNKENANL